MISTKARPVVTNGNEIDSGVIARAHGCLLGQFAGDSLGGLVEFRNAEDILALYPGGVRELADGGSWNTIAGQPTDDSELALMLARSLVERGAFDDGAVARAYGHWYASGPFDCGGTIARATSVASRVAADHAATARKYANTESQANGALMRLSPLGVFGHALRPEEVAELARRDASLTHPHAVCQDASAVFAVTVARAVSRGGTAAELFGFAVEWADAAGLHADVRADLRAATEEPPADFSRNMGWVRIALHNAFYQLRHADSLEAGVVDTVMCGGDTDTNAAIAGALLGAVYGESAVPRQWREAVLNCRPAAGVPGVRRPRPREFWPVDALELADQLIRRGAEFAKGV
jgi:ADP-ribosylglycohydrolase